MAVLGLEATCALVCTWALGQTDLVLVPSPLFAIWVTL